MGFERHNFVEELVRNGDVERMRVMFGVEKNIKKDDLVFVLDKSFQYQQKNVIDLLFEKFTFEQLVFIFDYAYDHHKQLFYHSAMYSHEPFLDVVTETLKRRAKASRVMEKRQELLRQVVMCDDAAYLSYMNTLANILDPSLLLAAIRHDRAACEKKLLEYGAKEDVVHRYERQIKKIEKE